ncbi:MAG: hypothetical protein ACK5XX_05180 [Holosporales bacterium]|jgi:hypothetical protein
MDTLHAHIATAEADWLESVGQPIDVAYLETDQPLPMFDVVPQVLTPKKESWYRPWRPALGTSFLVGAAERPITKADAALLNEVSPTAFNAQSFESVADDMREMVAQFVYVPLPAAITERPKSADDELHLSDEEIRAARAALTGTMVHQWTIPRDNKAVRSLRAKLNSAVTLEPPVTPAPSEIKTPAPLPPASPPAAKPTTEAPRLHPAIPPIAAPAVPVRQNPLQLRPVAPAAEPRSSFSGRGNDSGLTEDFLNSSYAKFWDTAFNTRPLNVNMDTDTLYSPQPAPKKPTPTSPPQQEQKRVEPPQDTPAPEGFLAAIQAGLAQAAADAAIVKETPLENIQPPSPIQHTEPQPQPAAAPILMPEAEPESLALQTPQQPTPEPAPEPEPSVTHWKPSPSGGAMMVLSDFNPAFDRVILTLGALTYTITEDSGRIALRFSNKDQLRLSHSDMDLTEAAVLAALTFDSTITAPFETTTTDPKPATPKKKTAPRKKAAALPALEPDLEIQEESTKAEKKPAIKKAPAKKTDEKPAAENAADDVERFLSGDIGFDDLF